MPDRAPAAGAFPPTRWTLIARLKSGDEAAKRRALADPDSETLRPRYNAMLAALDRALV